MISVDIQRKGLTSFFMKDQHFERCPLLIQCTVLKLGRYVMGGRKEGGSNVCEYLIKMSLYCM